jgi:hypothetical protein
MRNQSTQRLGRQLVVILGIGLCLQAISACDPGPTPSENARERRARAAAQRERFIAAAANRFGAKMALETDWKADADSDQVLTHVMQARVQRWQEPQLLFLQLDDILVDGDTVRIFARKGDSIVKPWLFELRCSVRALVDLPRRTDADAVDSGFGDEYLVVADSLKLDVSARGVYESVRGREEVELRYRPPIRIVGACKSIQRLPSWLDD